MRLTNTRIYTFYLLCFVFLFSGSVLLNSCKHNANNFQPTGDTVADGEKMVQKYCTSCHKLVPADALTNDVWRFHTLPSMSHYMGLSTYGPDYFKENPDSA